MLLTYKRKLFLTEEQKQIIQNMSDEARILYNYLLEQKQDFYNKNKKDLSYYDLQKVLKSYSCTYLTYDIKKEVCRCLDNNFKSYFRLLKQNKKLNPKPPKFRSKNYFFTLSFTQDFLLKENTLILSNKFCKYLKIPFERHIFNDISISVRNKSKSILKQCKLYKKDNDYFVSIIYEFKQVTKHQDENLICIDLGKKNFITYYDEKTNQGCWFNSQAFYDNQKYFDKRIDGLKKLRDQKIKHSIKWDKLNNKKRKLENKKNQQVKLNLHSLSKKLSKLNRNIIIGELTNLKSNILSDYRRMNRQMQNNWQLKIFTDQLEYKCKKEGRKLVKINEAWTSKTCCFCGNINYDLTPADRIYTCDCCGKTINRDVNGAINILKVYKQKLGDYTTPNLQNITCKERFFGNYQKTNSFNIDLPQ